MESGGDLLSRTVTSQVPSALKSLTSVFGMGTGGTSPSLPPEIVNLLVSRDTLYPFDAFILAPMRLFVNSYFCIYRVFFALLYDSSLYGQVFSSFWRAKKSESIFTMNSDHLAPQVGLEPTTTRLTAECSAIELLRNIESGSDLSSRAVSSQVLSALESLTSVFGMGTGGTSPSLPPEIVNLFVRRTLTTAQFRMIQSRPFPISLIFLFRSASLRSRSVLLRS